MTVPFKYSRKHLLILLAGFSILFQLLATPMGAFAQEFGEKYHACVNEASGLATFVDPDEACKPFEYRITLYDATEIDGAIASLESRIQSLEIQAAGLDSAVADEALARSSADNELSSQILLADQSLSVLETQMGEVGIILDGWWGDVGSLPIPMPEPAWFENVNIALGDYASLPIPLPEPAWFEDVEFILDGWWGDVGSLPIPMPEPAWFENINIALGDYASLPIPLPEPAWFENVEFILDGWWGDVGTLPGPLPEPAWFDQVSLDISSMAQDILDIVGDLPGPMP